MASTVEQRLKDREEARKSALEQAKVVKEGEKKEEETQEYFYSHFTKLSQEIEDMLNCASEKNNSKEHFDEISMKLQSLQKLLADSSLFLPRYNLRTSQQKITELKHSVQTKQDQLMPRKKFAFSSRKKTAAPSKPDEDTKPTESAVSDKEINGDDSNDTVLTAAAVTTVTTASNNTTPKNTIDIRDKSSTTISLTPNDGYDVSLTNLDSCTVEIIGSPGTVHISKVTGTRLLCGPVKRSVFIEDCSKCQFAVACQQLRIHSTTETDFYLHVTSKAIIEDSNSVRFAPYNFTYPELSAHYQNSGLSTDVNNWDQIDDFNWLTSKAHSPNWSLLPEDLRIKSWK